MKKVDFDNRTNLIEQAVYKYNLPEIAENNLFRKIFTYTEIPKITLNVFDK